MIVNKVNGKTYVGQHKSDNWQDKYMGSGTYLKRAKRKYGIKNFEKFLIQYCNTQEEANKAEIFWIAEYRKRGKAEYNIAAGGEGSSGWKCSEETRKKLSEAKKGRPGYWLGKHVSDETRRKVSEHHKGKRLSEETRKKISEANKSRRHSEETKKKMSEANKGKHHSEETKRKISEAKKDKHWKLVDGKRVWY